MINGRRRVIQRLNIEESQQKEKALYLLLLNRLRNRLYLTNQAVYPKEGDNEYSEQSCLCKVLDRMREEYEEIHCEKSFIVTIFSCKIQYITRMQSRAITPVSLSKIRNSISKPS